jgi:hypothetical protein
MVDQPDGDFAVDEGWVTVTEAAEKTGYHRDYVLKLARDNWALSEDERAIRLRRHSYGYMLWLPDLIAYFDKNPGTGRGPRPRSEYLP